MKKRILSLILALSMMISLLPAVSLAADPEAEIITYLFSTDALNLSTVDYTETDNLPANHLGYAGYNKAGYGRTNYKGWLHRGNSAPSVRDTTKAHIRPDYNLKTAANGEFVGYEYINTDVSRKWMYAGQKKANNIWFESKANNGLYFQVKKSNLSGNYVKLKIYVPSPGKYNVLISGSNTSSVYTETTRPAEAEFYISATETAGDDDKIGNFQFFNMTGESVGVFEPDAAGDYYLTFKISDTEEAKAAADAYITEKYKDNGDESKRYTTWDAYCTGEDKSACYGVNLTLLSLVPQLPAIESAKLAFDEDENTVSLESVMLDNGKELSLDKATVEYSFEEDESRISINSVTGKITPCMEEVSVTVTGKVTYGKSSFTAELPVTVKALEYSDYYFKYDFTVDTKEARLDEPLDQAYTKEFWNWADYGSRISTFRAYNGYLQIGTYQGNWAAFRIKVPVAGIYKTRFTYYAGTSNNAGPGKIYVLPGDTTDIDSALGGSTPLGEVNFKAEKATSGLVAELADAVFEKPGEYYLVFSAKDYTDRAHNMYPEAIEFIGGEELAVMSLFANKDEFVIETGDTDKLFAEEVYLSDYSFLEDYTVDFVSADTDIAEVSADGTITGKTPGETTVTATIEYNGTRAQRTVDVLVLHEGSSKYYVSYDLTEPEFEAATYENTDKFRKYLGENEIEINVPVAGRYNITAEGGSGDITIDGNETDGYYIFPEAGKYAVKFEGTVPDKLVLLGGKKLAPMNARMSFAGTIASVDEIILSDGSSISPDEAEITYSVEELAVASVDPVSGKILSGKEGGTTNVIATVTYDGLTANGEVEITLDPSTAVPSSATLYFEFNRAERQWMLDNANGSDPEYGGPTSWYVKGITYADTDGWAWYEGNASSLNPKTTIWSGEGLVIQPGAGAWMGLKLNIPTAGRYWATLENSKSFDSAYGKMEVYVVPYTEDTAELAASLTPENKVTTINGRDESLEGKTAVHEEIGAIDFETAGEYILVFKDLGENKKIYIKTLKLDGTNGVTFADFTLDRYTLAVGDKLQATLFARLLDGSVATENDATFVFSSSDDTVASFIHGEAEAVGGGEAELSMKAFYGTLSAESVRTVTVVNNSEVLGVEASVDKEWVYAGKSISLSAQVNYAEGQPKKLDNADVTYTVTEGTAEIKDGKLTSDTAGFVTVVAEYDGMESVPLTVEFKEGYTKTASSYYTDEKFEAAKENIKKYDWAKSDYNTIESSAEANIDLVDNYYSGLVGKGLPKGSKLGFRNDTNYVYCRYCGVDIDVKYGGYTYDFSRMWKIQCPDCKRLFPSNDFEKFYELGREGNVNFDADHARQRHHEMFVCADGEECTCTAPTEKYSDEWYEFYGYGLKGGYLYNDLYSELVSGEKANIDPRTGDEVVGARWGVDDGWGYRTGRTTAAGIEEAHTYIAYFANVVPSKLLHRAHEFARMYRFTGDKKFGRAGAILIDRYADIFPEAFTSDFYDEGFTISGGGSERGKLTGMIADSQRVELYAKTADALFPYLKEEDPELIAYLSAKAEEYGLENKKTCGADIWRNWSDNLLWESFAALKSNDLLGNTGYPQSAAASLIMVLNEEPRSSEILDWLFTGAPVYGSDEMVHNYSSGGNLAHNFVGLVDRDGMGNEASPAYIFDWMVCFTEVAEYLEHYTDDPKYDLYQNPRFMLMYSACVPLTLVKSQVAQIGDSGSTAGNWFKSNYYDSLQFGFYYLKDSPVGKDVAEQIYLQNGDSVEGLHYDMYVKDPESMQTDILSLVDETTARGSEMMTGYGFAILRDGDEYGEKSSLTYNNNMRDFWMWYGVNGDWAHAHYDALNLGIEAYGLNMAPDLGYPQTTGKLPSRLQWTKATISHNTVVVNEENQIYQGTRNAFPQHFDDSGEVKVMDIDASEAYEETSIYRRTLIMINAGDDVSYGVDFFRVKGGQDHIYSFHSQSNSIYETEGLGEIQYQTDDGTANGEFVGSYAGPDVPYGADPSNTTKETGLQYKRGYTWMKNVRKAFDVNKFSIDYNVTDFNKAIKDNKNLHMRVTMLNDFELSEVAMTHGRVPTKTENANLPPQLEYMLARRTAENGESLDSLYTTVYEPYRGERYLSDMETVAITTDESVGADDVARAVKVIRRNADGTDGRVDYVIYATNNNVIYTVTDGEISFNFRGFAGVYSVGENGTCIYSYVHDGDIIGENVSGVKRYTGYVEKFTDTLELDNYIWISSEDITNPSELVGKYMFIDNDKVENGVYKIESAESDGDSIKLGTGIINVLREYKDKADTSLGFVYNIGKGQRVTIPISNVNDSNPVFSDVENTTVSAGSSITFTVSATPAEDAESITYAGASLPRGASIDAATGKFTWKPDGSQVGENHVAITAYDEFGRESTVHFTVTVYGSTTSKPSDSSDEGASTDSTGTGTGSAGGGGGGGGGATDTGASTDSTDDTTITDETGNADDSSQSDTDDTETGNTGNVRFIDLGNHAWAEDSINTLASDGIIKGTTYNTYSPANNITRADFALLLVRAFELESDNTENFADVSASDYFASELAIARNKGIVQGIGNNLYAPRNTITRQDMMVIVYRALQTLSVAYATALPEGEPRGEEYTDFADVASYAREAVSALIGAGIVNGKNNLIAPLDYTTRAEVAVLIKRILDYVK